MLLWGTVMIGTALPTQLGGALWLGLKGLKLVVSDIVGDFYQRTGIDPKDGELFLFHLPEDDFPSSAKHLSGNWFLTRYERLLLFQCIRVRSLKDPVHDLGRVMRRLVEEKFKMVEGLSWESFPLDDVESRLMRVNKARLEDPLLKFRMDFAK
jgi:hypothetical protein